MEFRIHPAMSQRTASILLPVLFALAPAAWALPNPWKTTLKVPATGVCGEYLSLPCAPGETLSGECYVKTDGMTAGSARISMVFQGRGRALRYGWPVPGRPQESASPHRVRLFVRGVAPEGTDTVQIYLQAYRCNPGALASFDTVAFRRVPAPVPGAVPAPADGPNLWTTRLQVPDSGTCGVYKSMPCKPGEIYQGWSCIRTEGMTRGSARVGIVFQGGGRALRYAGPRAPWQPETAAAERVTVSVRGVAPPGADTVQFYIQAYQCNPGAVAVFDTIGFERFPAPALPGPAASSGSPGTLPAEASGPCLYDFDPDRLPSLRATSGPAVLSLLDRMTYVPAERNQGTRCGSCVAWATTGLLELELFRKYGIRDRLSVQFPASNGGAKAFCVGVGYEEMGLFYNRVKMLVPWSNPNAEYRSADGLDPALDRKSPIILNPHYKLRELEFHWLFEDFCERFDHAAMIETIKQLLQSGKPVMYIAPSAAAPASPHASMIIGYDQQSPDPRDHRWLLLNSWGATGADGSSTYTLPMNLDYSTTVAAPPGPDGQPANLRYCRHSFQIISNLELELQPHTLPAPEIIAGAGELAEGAPLKLMATVASRPPVAYRWFKNGDHLPGATGSTLVIARATLADAGNYAVEVTNAAGAVQSPVTAVTVVPAGPPLP